MGTIYFYQVVKWVVVIKLRVGVYSLFYRKRVETCRMD